VTTQQEAKLSLG